MIDFLSASQFYLDIRNLNCACPNYKFGALLAHMPTGEITANGKQILVSGTTKFSIGFLLPLFVIHLVKFMF